MTLGAGTHRNWPRILLLTAMPLTVALIVIQFVRPDQPAVPRSMEADGPAAVAPARSLPAWPTPRLEAVAAPTPAVSTVPTEAAPTGSARPALSSTPAPTTAAGPAPSSTPSPARPFTPISVEAEAPGNLLNGAQVASCVTCDGGARVRYIDDVNYLEVYVTLPEAGTRTVSVRYESDGDRRMAVRINDGPTTVHPVTGSGGWETPATVTFEAHLPAGRVAIRFSGQSPDIDRVIVS